MLSIAKINSAYNQTKHSATTPGGYLFYLQSSGTRQRTDFLDYLNPIQSVTEPQPFWSGSGIREFDLADQVDLNQVEKLAFGYSPKDGQSLVRGAGALHVMGIDMTFSAPKDVSAIFAAADTVTQSAINECMQKAVRSAIDYTQSISVTRHGAAGRIKKKVSSIIAACYPHFASRAIQPQLHVHAFLFNLGKRSESKEWSALDNKAQFDHKLATGMLFRVDLAYHIAQLGFEVIPDGQYFKIKGISDHQRQALSKRRAEIQAFMDDHEGKTSLDADIAALNTRSAKAEPPYFELIEKFRDMVKALGLTHEYVESLQSQFHRTSIVEFPLSHQDLLDELTQTRSTVKAQDVLHLICKKMMGLWSAEQCREHLKKFLQYEEVLHLGNTEHLTNVITSRFMYEKERAIVDRVERGRDAKAFSIRQETVTRFFDDLRDDLSHSTGHEVNLEEQEAAAQYIFSSQGTHAFVVGSAGTGKTTLLKAVANIYRSENYELVGCAQAASAALNLTREAGIPSLTIASLLLRHQKGNLSFSANTILVLDEAGMVGSREFDLLQTAVVEAGGKMVCVGDYKQHASIEAGGIFRSLVEKFGGAHITKIQRQRTDFSPIYRVLGDSSSNRKSLISNEQLTAIKSLSVIEQSAALDALAGGSALLASLIRPWQSKFDFHWMREVVDQFSQGHAEEALTNMAVKGQIYMEPDRERAMAALVEEWKKDDRALKDKVIIAGLRNEVAALNQQAREHLIAAGHLDRDQARILPLLQRDGRLDHREFIPGDRIVITKNNPALGLINGATGTFLEFDGQNFLSVQLDEPNAKGASRILIPTAFHHLDHSYSLTTFKSQGRTFDSAYVFVNPVMAHREWIYVAASRTRYRTALYVPENEIGQSQTDELQHQEEKREDELTSIQKLSRCLARSQIKSTTLDYEEAQNLNVPEPTPPPSISVHRIIEHARNLQTRCKEVALHWVQRIKEKAFEQELHR
ncbi:hypothetical protein EJD96_16170 [Herbaspirillum seropedicae]|uniref:MobF family relaxase n=1 Tax=Herbaspirillum seropedicae TaxID=964 RepID=UPI00111D8B69|nr:MobF family relaxase [Herbaspirillum seropedicae]QDD65585.1 hypothetical protein EJD96_16170 [Herbaspirillum seropedicae]